MQSTHEETVKMQRPDFKRTYSKRLGTFTYSKLYKYILNFFSLHQTNFVYLIICVEISECQEMEFNSPLKAKPKSRSCMQVVFLEDRLEQNRKRGKVKLRGLYWVNDRH